MKSGKVPWPVQNCIKVNRQSDADYITALDAIYETLFSMTLNYFPAKTRGIDVLAGFHLQYISSLMAG